jgi:imidazolonepropionase-like amidohydrolase
MLRTPIAQGGRDIKACFQGTALPERVKGFSMSRILAVISCTLLVGCTQEPASQQAQPPTATQGSATVGIVISNARIIDGNGGVIERGIVTVKEGRIASVSVDAAEIPGALQIDAEGLTVMPGFIDGHRHVIQSDPDRWLKKEAASRMQEYLDAGFTTIQSCGDPLEQISELRRQLTTNEIAGPRLFTSGFVPLSGGPRGGDGPREDPARATHSWAPRQEAADAIPADVTRATVERYAAAEVDALKTVLMLTPGGPEQATLELVVAESEKAGIPVITHAVTVQDTVAAVEARVAALVHTPVEGELTPEKLVQIAEAGIPMMSTLGVFVPFFGKENEPVFRDGTPFPWERLYHAGEGAVNARLLWNAGITYGFGTDTPFGPATGWVPRDSLAHELRSLSLVFSPRDIVTILTRNSAAALGRSNELGTLEAGKLADIVLLEGDPLTGTDALLNVKVVIKDGAVVVDKR